MSWTQTHIYYRTLTEIETRLDRTGDGIVPWRPEYADVFGDPDGLLAALRLRWQRMVEAQGDDIGFGDLAAAHPGLLRALMRGHRPSVPSEAGAA